MKIVNFSIWLAGLSFVFGCQPNAKPFIESIKPMQPASAVIPVRILHTKNGYELQRGGKPFQIKGAAGLQHFEAIRKKGGNSVRLYTANYADIFLDEAQRNGLTVMFGLWMKPPYEKFDYYDPKVVAEQQREVYRQVLLYKNHPALLMWNLGNELDNRAVDLKVYQIVNETAQMIHKLDPNHPVTTATTSNISYIPALNRLCPDLDVLTVNVFDRLANQPGLMAHAGWSGPFIIGEFGGRGWWEAPQTSWNAPLDQSSTEKAKTMERGYRAAIEGNRSHCLGSYVLFWGNRFEQTDMWLSMFSASGEKTPMVDMMEYLWTQKKPTDLAPQVGTMRLAGQQDIHSVVLQPNADYPASIIALDPEGDSLRVEWRITREVDEFNTLPQNRTAPEPLAGAIRQAHGLKAQVRAPAERGAYRLLASVYDQHGSVTAHSFPFFVGQPEHPEKGIHMPRDNF